MQGGPEWNGLKFGLKGVKYQLNWRHGTYFQYIDVVSDDCRASAFVVVTNGDTAHLVRHKPHNCPCLAVYHEFVARARSRGLLAIADRVFGRRWVDDEQAHSSRPRHDEHCCLPKVTSNTHVFQF